MHAFSQKAARSRAAYTKPRILPLARRRTGGRAAFVAQIDRLMDAPLTDSQRITAIGLLIGRPHLRVRLRPVDDN